MAVNPELRLAAAVLERAVLDYLQQRGVHKAHTVAWFASSSDQPYSFLWLCEHLEIDAARVKKLLDRVTVDPSIVRNIAPRTKFGFIRKLLDKDEIVILNLYNFKQR